MYHQSWKKTICIPTQMYIWGAMIWIVCAIPSTVQGDTRSELNQLNTQLQRQTTRIGILGQSLRRINPSGRVSLSKRLSDGQVNFLLKDYLRASILLLDAAENPRYKGRSKWYDAVYILAESLYRNRNYQGAIKYYRVLTQRGQKHSQKALVRLMEISAKTQKSSWLNQYFQKGKELPSGALRNKIYYLRAKGLYQMGKNTEARTLFQRISSTTEYGSRALYFLAVIALQNGGKANVKEAIKHLSSALSSTPKDKRNLGLREIILISQGRLHMEQKQYTKALRFFQQISRRSKVFDQALYEICWAYVRRGDTYKKKNLKRREYNRALRTLDLLLAFLPQSPFYPKAQLLKGNLQLQLAPFQKGKTRERLFGQSMRSYQKIAARYGRVYKEMEQIANRPRPIELFERLVAQQLDQFSVAKILPQDAIRWMSDEELMGRTLRILKDLRSMQSQLKSAKQIIERLESVLRVRGLHSLSPTLRDAKLRCSNSKAKLIEISEKLVRLKERIVRSKLNASEEKEYQELRKKLKVLRYLFLQTPRTSKALRNRSSAVKYRIRQMNGRLHKISILLAYSKKALRSIRRWLETNEDARQLTPSQRSNLETDANQLARMVSTLQREKAQLQNTLSLAQIRLGYASAAPQEKRTQNRYQRLLERESQFYNRIKSRLSSSEQAEISNIQDASRRVRSQQVIVKGYFSRLSTLSTQFATRVRSQLTAEKLKINQYEQQIGQLRSGSKTLASQIAYNTFQSVRKKFRKLVLQAEVGVIDVAWKEKQTIQAQKIRLNNERNSELRVLDSEFRDLVQEVK